MAPSCESLMQDKAVYLALLRKQERSLSGPFCLCGGGEIRTLDTLSDIPVFKTGAFNRSATPPLLISIEYSDNSKKMSLCNRILYSFKHPLSFCYNTPMKLLGIDYGSKRIGLSISDDTATVAFPYKTIINTAKCIDEILEIIKAERVIKVVLGESKDRNMKDNLIMVKIHAFKKDLEEKGIEVQFHSEFFSSSQVVSIMGEQNKSIDASAAAIILQSYLDLQKYL